MNTPITANFFRKIELYQEVVSLNKIFHKSVWEFKDGSKDTWEIEKKILYWSRHGHKHLGSTIEAKDFNAGSEKNKSCRLAYEEVFEKKGGGRFFLDNIERRGYAERRDRKFIINSKGLLMGAVLNDIYKLKRIDKQKFWHTKFWNTYKTKYGAQHFLAKRYQYW